MTCSINYTKPQLNLSPTNNYIINTYTKTSLVPSPPASSLTSFSTLLALDSGKALDYVLTLYLHPHSYVFPLSSS